MIEADDCNRQRLDKWLWHARVVRTRADAIRLVRSGIVRINGQRVDHPAKTLKLGDVITVALGQGMRLLRVRAFAPKRGSATDAAVLFERLAPDGTPLPPKSPDEVPG